MAPRPIVFLSLLFLLAGPFVLGCGDDDGGAGPGPGSTGTGEIGSGGGSVTSQDGALEITVPPGALATTETITTEARDPSTLPSIFDGRRVEAAYDIGPDGLTFSAPVTIEFTSEQTVFPSALASGNVVLIPTDLQ